ncbi:helix-turn-helix domain-containing protein, partial [Deinococcus wulumuqiensis]
MVCLGSKNPPPFWGVRRGGRRTPLEEVTHIQATTHLKTFRYRLRPTKAQEVALLEQLRLCRGL